jgi:hypothetical protein
MGVSCAAWVTDADGEPCYRSCADPSAPHGVHFRLFPKNASRRFVTEQAGGDPAKLKYNPWKRKSGPRFDDNGVPI